MTLKTGQISFLSTNSNSIVNHARATKTTVVLSSTVAELYAESLGRTKFGGITLVGKVREGEVSTARGGASAESRLTAAEHGFAPSNLLNTYNLLHI